MVRNGRFKSYLRGGVKTFVWTWGTGERESGKGYPRWMGRHLQLQDAAEELSPGGLRSMGPSSRDLSVWSSGVSWRLRRDSYQPCGDHGGQRGVSHAPEQGCSEKAGRSKKRSLSDFHVFGLIELDQPT